MTNKSSAPNPTFTSVKGNKLVDTGKHWSIETESGQQINTGRRKLADAKGVLTGYENISTSDATLTGELQDMGKNWGAVMSDGSAIDLGKTNKASAQNLMTIYGFMGDGSSGSSNNENVVINDTGGSTTDDTLSGLGGNVSDEAENLVGPGAEMESGDVVEELLDFSVLENQGYSPEEKLQKKQEMIAEAERRKQIRQMISRNRMRRFGGMRLLMSQDRFSPGMGVSDYAGEVGAVRFNPRG